MDSDQPLPMARSGLITSAKCPESLLSEAEKVIPGLTSLSCSISISVALTSKAPGKHNYANEVSFASLAEYLEIAAASLASFQRPDIPNTPETTARLYIQLVTLSDRKYVSIVLQALSLRARC
jgi:hypothetical protein